MSELIIDILSYILILIGIIFFLGAGIGVFRFPDFYTRMHAAGKGDTLSTVCLLLGCGLQYLSYHHFNLGSWLVLAKIGLIILFVFIGSPTATHAIMDAGYETEVKHWRKGDKQ